MTGNQSSAIQIEVILDKKKSLGQHFLTNEGVVQSIASCIDITGKHVIEVGPGEGALTQKIIENNPKSLSLIELDHDLIPILECAFGKSVSIYHGDVLKSDITGSSGVHVHFDTDKKKSENGKLKTQNLSGGYIVFGNIPYYITSPIITHFLYTVTSRPSHMILMMQKEVADKIRKKDGKHSVFSLSCDLMCSRIRKVIDVSPGSFSPPPKVSSTVLLFELDTTQDPILGTRTLNLIKKGFAEKRKKLIRNLKAGISTKKEYSWEQVFDELSLDKDIRAEDVELHVWRDMIPYIN